MQPTAERAEIADPAASLSLDRDVRQAIRKAREALLSLQHPDGYWCFELEADCTIPAEYILMMHYMDEIDPGLESSFAHYLRANQQEHGGWSLFPGGEFDISCSVKVYYALKLAGHEPDSAHMVRARKAILQAGGAARSNVFTRMTLALFGQIPWRGVPFTPVEIMLFPLWFLFHLSKVSYWSRTVMVPLTILCSLKPRAKNPRNVHIRELFVTPPHLEKRYFPVRSTLNRVFLMLDKLGRSLEPIIPRAVRRIAVRKAEKWFTERLNGEDGLGAIFPAMVNAHEALACLGYPANHPYRLMTRKALQKLVVKNGDWSYCQPCVSPVWDTALACLALEDEGTEDSRSAALRGLKWLEERQVLDEPGDWRENRPGLPGGGWAFQFNNPHYPDLDDTAAVGWAMAKYDAALFRKPLSRAVDWVCGMQSKNGGFASFDADNTHCYLNEIPFADHGALLDPPTSDVSARCATLLALAGRREPHLSSCLAYLEKEQELNGSWFGRWGTNYIYGTWSVLAGLEKTGAPLNGAMVKRAVSWLKSVQREDGGWGEDCATYFHPETAGRGSCSTSFQTAWAILALIAGGDADSDAVRRGVRFLLKRQRPDGFWHDESFTAPGFPRVFYLRYHGYSKYFPLWALARYANRGHNGKWSPGS
ncbi:MAG TPA: squalene--hopene cyclase [Thermodesulfobacteriota bacterium]|nr:squalene--hopene cyclase [Thermodesulfobacteriota bacterium]